MIKSLFVSFGMALIFTAMLLSVPALTNNGAEPRQVMCEIKQYESVHLMPCRLIDSYLAEVQL